jgi:CubicO group peptidase (beta-lactamase class C family)
MKKTTFFLLVAFLSNLFSYGQALNKTKLDTLLKKAARTHSEAIIIYKDNGLITENYFGIGKADNKIEAMSCTKSIVGLAVACMLNDRLIDSLDVPVAQYYPEWRQGQKQLITLRHLVNMTSGIQNNPNASIEIYPSPDFVQLALTAELSSKPGEVWSYNNKSMNLMAGVIKKITGKRMDEYIGERLFKPLGITDYTWSLDSVGNPHVMSGCQIKPADFARIGLLLLQHGKYNGRQIIGESFMDQLTVPCKQYEGYGLLWWIDYEKTTSIIDDAHIAALTKAGVSAAFMEKVKKIKGRYTSRDVYFAAIQKVFGENPWPYLNENLGPVNLALSRKEYGGNRTYRADGYLGNYIIVDPATKIVAIRMISHDSFQDDNDNFVEFKQLVLDLVK